MVSYGSSRRSRCSVPAATDAAPFTRHRSSGTVQTVTSSELPAFTSFHRPTPTATYRVRLMTADPRYLRFFAAQAPAGLLDRG